MELDVVVVKILEPGRGVSAKGEWVRQEVVFEQPNDFNRKVCITFWGDRAQEVASMKPGDAYTLSVNVESREFNNKWYTSLQAWKVLRKNAEPAAPTGSPAPWAAPDAPAAAPVRELPPLEGAAEGGSYKEDPVDDLPF